MFNETDVRQLLRLKGSEREDLCWAAVGVRRRIFGRGVIVRAECEVANVFPMRRSKTRANNGYRMTAADLIETAVRVRADKLSNVICFQGGEVPQTTKLTAEALPAVRQQFGGDVEVMLNLGLNTYDEYAELKAAGATSYILKHETSDPDLHQRLRHESLDDRWACLEDLLSLGYKVGSGIIVGLPGQSLDSIAADIIACRDAGVHMMSAAPFIPAPNTPLANQPPGSVELTLTVMAAMRLVNPDWIIPSVSALRHTGPHGQMAGFIAGANAMVYNATPQRFRGQYFIYGKDRRVSPLDYVTETIASLGMVPARSVFAGANWQLEAA